MSVLTIVGVIACLSRVFQILSSIIIILQMFYFTQVDNHWLFRTWIKWLPTVNNPICLLNVIYPKTVSEYVYDDFYLSVLQA